MFDPVVDHAVAYSKLSGDLLNGQLLGLLQFCRRDLMAPSDPLDNPRGIRLTSGAAETFSIELISNLHIEIDDEGMTASARSYVTVFQAVTDFPLQPVFIGQYQDKFKKVDGKWRFAERECEPYLAGDLSRHAREYPPPGPVRLP